MARFPAEVNSEFGTAASGSGKEAATSPGRSKAASIVVQRNLGDEGLFFLPAFPQTFLSTGACTLVGSS